MRQAHPLTWSALLVASHAHACSHTPWPRCHLCPSTPPSYIYLGKSSISFLAKLLLAQALCLLGMSIWLYSCCKAAGRTHGGLTRLQHLQGRCTLHDCPLKLHHTCSQQVWVTCTAAMKRTCMQSKSKQQRTHSSPSTTSSPSPAASCTPCCTRIRSFADEDLCWRKRRV